MNTRHDDDHDGGSEDLQKLLWENELRKQPFILEALEKYHDYSVSAWLGLYTCDKYEWMRHLREYEREDERRQLRWVKKAYVHLEIILQKKLFDLQCRWRAEQLKLPGIEICYDFIVWECDVFNCPFLEPVTQAELEQYIQYLQHPAAEPAYKNEDALGYLEEWQDYDELKKVTKRGGTMPAWYKYHNEFLGGDKIFALPDIRGVKETRYHDLTVASRSELAVIGKKFENFHLFMHEADEQLKSQALEYEGPVVRRARELYQWRAQHEGREAFLSDAVRDLLESGEPVPVGPNDSWVTALTELYRGYQCRRIAAVLPEVYEQYCFKRDIGIAFHRTGIGGESPETIQSCRRTVLEHILTGRRLAGEQEDLDF